MKHWYRRGPLAWLLWPASLAYALVVLFRRFLYAARVLPIGGTTVTTDLVKGLSIPFAEAQRAKYLAPILAGEHVWCQGYSEPNAGSDLANLQTSAVIDGERSAADRSRSGI